MQILNGFINEIKTQDLNTNDVEKAPIHKLDTDEYYTSKEHLEYMKTKSKFDLTSSNGYAQVINGINLGITNAGKVSDETRKTIQ
jgi:hypothetical protein